MSVIQVRTVLEILMYSSTFRFLRSGRTRLTLIWKDTEQVLRAPISRIEWSFPGAHDTHDNSQLVFVKMRISPLPSKTLDLLSVKSTRENSNATQASPPTLPYEVIGKIFHHGVTPYVKNSTGSTLARLMLLNRRSLAEVDHMLMHDSLLRKAWIKEQQIVCEEKIAGILDDRRLTYNDMLERVDAVLSETQHVSVNIGSVSPNFETSRDVLALISKKTDMKSLRLSADESFQTNPYDLVNSLHKILRNNPGLIESHLILNTNQITAAHLPALIDGLQGNAFGTLVLSLNPIKNAGIQMLSDRFPSTKVSRLDLDECGIGDEGVKHLMQSLPEGLRKLSLEYNKITIEGLQHVVDALSSSTLAQVFLRGNRFAKAEAEDLLATSRLKNKSVNIIF